MWCRLASGLPACRTSPDSSSEAGWGAGRAAGHPGAVVGVGRSTGQSALVIVTEVALAKGVSAAGGYQR
jgi:hypothetical protein